MLKVLLANAAAIWNCPSARNSPLKGVGRWASRHTNLPHPITHTHTHTHTQTYTHINTHTHQLYLSLYDVDANVFTALFE